jgi:hypothetical protein
MAGFVSFCAIVFMLVDRTGVAAIEKTVRGRAHDGALAGTIAHPLETPWCSTARDRPAWLDRSADTPTK